MRHANHNSTSSPGDRFNKKFRCCSAMFHIAKKIARSLKVIHVHSKLQLRICIQYHHNNVIVKYADDTYLIIPANNQNTCKAEIEHIEQWANCNNLKLNRSIASPRKLYLLSQDPADKQIYHHPLYKALKESNASRSWASLLHTTSQ